MSPLWEVVQLHFRQDGSIEVAIRRTDRYEAYGGVLKKWPGDPRAIYPAGYFSPKENSGTREGRDG